MNYAFGTVLLMILFNKSESLRRSNFSDRRMNSRLSKDLPRFNISLGEGVDKGRRRIIPEGGKRLITPLLSSEVLGSASSEEEPRKIRKHSKLIGRFSGGMGPNYPRQETRGSLMPQNKIFSHSQVEVQEGVVEPKNIEIGPGFPETGPARATVSIHCQSMFVRWLCEDGQPNLSKSHNHSQSEISSQYPTACVNCTITMLYMKLCSEGTMPGRNSTSYVQKDYETLRDNEFCSDDLNSFWKKARNGVNNRLCRIQLKHLCPHRETAIFSDRLKNEQITFKRNHLINQRNPHLRRQKEASKVKSEPTSIKHIHFNQRMNIPLHREFLEEKSSRIRPKDRNGFDARSLQRGFGTRNAHILPNEEKSYDTNWYRKPRTKPLVHKPE